MQARPRADITSDVAAGRRATPYRSEGVSRRSGPRPPGRRSSRRRSRLRRGARPAAPRRSRARVANAASGSASIGATAITPAGRSSPVAAAASASATTSPAGAPPRSGSPSMLDLHEDVDRVPAGPADAVGQGADELGPVQRVHDGRVPGDRGGLVALQPADEVPARPGHRGGLEPRVLVPVLAEVGHPERDQPAGVLDRERLGDPISVSSPGSRPAAFAAAPIRSRT